MAHLYSNQYGSTRVVSSADSERNGAADIQLTRRSYCELRQLCVVSTRGTTQQTDDDQPVKYVVWLNLTPEQCRELAHDLLIAAAQSADYSYPR